MIKIILLTRMYEDLPYYHAWNRSMIKKNEKFIFNDLNNKYNYRIGHIIKDGRNVYFLYPSSSELQINKFYTLS